MFEIFGLAATVARESLTAYWQESKLEEVPGLRGKETLEYARYISLQTQAEDWKGVMPGRKYYHCGVMHGTRFWLEDM